MARATHITIGTSDRIRLDARPDARSDARSDAGSNGYGYAGNGQGRYEIEDDEIQQEEARQDEVRQEVQVSVTYALDPGDTDLAALADEKAEEVSRAHTAAWHRIGAFGSTVNGCACPRCRDGSELEGNDCGNDDGPEAGEEPNDSPPQQSWYLPGASRLQHGSGGQHGTDSQPGTNSQTGTGRFEPPSVQDSPEPAEPLTGPQKILIRSRAAKSGLTAYGLETLLFQQFKVWRVERLSKAQAALLLVALERDLKEREAKEKQERSEAMEGFQKSAA